MQDSTDKQCPGCSAVKPLSDYHKCRTRPNGKQAYCKVCQAEQKRERKLRRAAARSDESSSETSEQSTEVVPAGYDLYVMTNLRIPGEYKVGRSKGVEQRREDLQNGQNFKMEVVATFPRAGWAEGSVQDRLAHSRVSEGPGREWFRASLSDILHAIGRILESEMP